jgi:hypothetical protein
MCKMDKKSLLKSVKNLNFFALANFFLTIYHTYHYLPLLPPENLNFTVLTFIVIKAAKNFRGKFTVITPVKLGIMV